MIAEIVRTIETSLKEKEYRIEILYSHTDTFLFTSRIYQLIHILANAVDPLETTKEIIGIWKEVEHLTHQVHKTTAEEAQEDSLELLHEL